MKFDITVWSYMCMDLSVCLRVYVFSSINVENWIGGRLDLHRGCTSCLACKRGPHACLRGFLSERVHMEA